MAIIINKDELQRTGTGWKFEGINFNDANISFFIIEALPGKGAKLHQHPYEEIFINLEGTATFTIGDETIKVEAGQVVIAPANVPHKFVNSGESILRQVDIHPVTKMVQTNFE